MTPHRSTIKIIFRFSVEGETANDLRTALQERLGIQLCSSTTAPGTFGPAWQELVFHGMSTGVVAAALQTAQSLLKQAMKEHGKTKRLSLVLESKVNSQGLEEDIQRLLRIADGSDETA